jgi:2-octaprenyl-6-methoxyphenol hydroxylase
MNGARSNAAVAIAGFGPVGAACAIACSMRFDDRQQIVILDGRAAALNGVDPRMIAISEGSRLILQRLGAWDERAASAISEIHVSQRGSFGRTLIKASDYRIPALGYVIAYHELTGMLQRRVAQLGILVRQVRVTDIVEAEACGQSGTQELSLALDDDSTLTTQFLVHAEGGTFGEQSAKPLTRRYRQHALSALVSANHLIPNRAYERFTVDGPIALLPTRHDGKQCYALVWCAKPLDCERRMQLGDQEFLLELGNQFGGRVGKFTSVTQRASFPLGLNVRTSWPSAREVGIGNASQTLHPVAGQGFNLGLRDALQLSEALSAAAIDPSQVARQFAAARRMDRGATVLTTDFLPRVFGISAPFVGVARGAALTLLDLIPPLRHPVAKQMMNGRR